MSHDRTTYGTGGYTTAPGNNVVDTATLPDPVLDPSEVPCVLSKRTMQYLKNPGATTAAVFGFAAAPALTGTAANADDADGPWMNLPTGLTSGSAAGVVSAFTVCRADWLPDFLAAIKTGAAFVTSRMWVGLFSASPDASSTPAIHLAAFRYDPAVDATAFWRCVTNNGGATPTVTTTSIPVNADRRYELRVDLTPVSASFYADNVLVAFHATTLPGATTLLGYAIRVVTTGAVTAARSIKWGRIALRHR